jgi:hypothetical protein
MKFKMAMGRCGSISALMYVLVQGVSTNIVKGNPSK